MEMPDFGPPQHYGPDPGPTIDEMLAALYPYVMPVIIMAVGVCIAIAIK